MTRTPRSAPPQSHNEGAPILVVVCDVEEEFDWSQPFDRRNTSVSAMSEIHRLQDLAVEYGLKPTYVVDYPVAAQSAGFEPLLGVLESGECEIGAHLHPWVTPPFEEEVTRFNSFAGNLGLELERSKLVELSDLLEKRFRLRPTTYKAGRYGIGAHTDRILDEEGFKVDLSPMPPFDFRDEGGPDFSDHALEPSLPRGREGFVRIPQTGAYTGRGRRWGRYLYPLVSSRALGALRVPGILSRLGVLDRLVLSPEGYSLEEMKRLTEVLLTEDVKVFCFSFHSPSLKPGFTPYVRDDEELELFLETCRAYFEYFVSDLSGRGMTAGQVGEVLLRSDN